MGVRNPPRITRHETLFPRVPVSGASCSSSSEPSGSRSSLPSCRVLMLSLVALLEGAPITRWRSLRSAIWIDPDLCFVFVTFLTRMTLLTAVPASCEFGIRYSPWAWRVSACRSRWSGRSSRLSRWRSLSRNNSSQVRDGVLECFQSCVGPVLCLRFFQCMESMSVRSLVLLFDKSLAIVEFADPK